MKICITGASGFIGKLLCVELLSQGHSISILTRKSVPASSAVKVVVGDLVSDGFHLSTFLDDVDVVCHCAGEIKDENLMYDVHVGGTRRLLQEVSLSIRRHRKAVHWVQLSSVGAYGVTGPSSHGSRAVDERSPERPVGVYEVTKTKSDRLVIDFARFEPLFSFTILRPTAVIGSNMPNKSFHAMARMIQRGFFFWIGRRNAIANYVHIEDVVRAMVVCVNDERARGRIFIISNDCPLRLVIEALALSMNVPRPKLVLPEGPLRLAVKTIGHWIKIPLTVARIDALTRQTQFSSALVTEVLGFSPTASIPEVIPKLIAESTARLALE